jgi:hypothetical protein
MGTNFHLYEPLRIGEWRNVLTNGRYEGIHIGKSSAGWCFKLRCDEELGLTSLQDWKKFLSRGRRRYRIHDDYGTKVSFAELMMIITERRGVDSRPWSRDRMVLNDAVPGPYGLVRHKIGDRCVAHG